MPNKRDPYSSSAQKAIGLYALLLFTGRKHSLPHARPLEKLCTRPKCKIGDLFEE